MSAHKQDCHSQGKYIWKMKLFPGQGKVRECCGWPGNFKKDLESQGFENEWLWQAVFRNLFILFERGKHVLSLGIVNAHFPPHRGLLLKEILSFKSNPRFEVIQLVPLK